MFETGCRGQEQGGQTEDKRCYSPSTRSQGSPSGMSTHSDWPEGTRGVLDTPPAAPKRQHGPASATSPTKPGLQARTASSGQQGRCLKQQRPSMKRVTTTVQPHHPSDKGDDASPVLKGSTSPSAGALAGKGLQGGETEAQLGRSSTDQGHMKRTPNAPDFSKVRL